MGKGYISLFFEDSGYELVTQEDLNGAKQKIWSDYKERFRNPNSLTQQNFQNIVDNVILQNLSSMLTMQNMSQQTDPIEYWGISMGQAVGIVKGCSTLLEQKKKIKEYAENAHSIIADSIKNCNGLISQPLIEQLENLQNRLESFCTDVDNAGNQDTFDKIFWKAIRSTFKEAQGAIHETAAVVASATAKQQAEAMFANANKDLKISIEHVGKKFDEDSEFGKALLENNIDLGRTSEPKSDLVIMVRDGNGKILWTTGISLKATSSKDPTFVQIKSKTLALLSLLATKYDKERIFNSSSGLGLNDEWDDDRRGIKKLAKSNQISLDSALLVESWKNMIYNTLYSEILNLFGGTGGALNDAQYLIINSRVISMYDIFNNLEIFQFSNNDPYAIKGLQIEGLGGKTDRGASIRHKLAQKNKDFFKKSAKGFSPQERRLERSRNIWQEAQSTLQSTKIGIKLNYAQLFGLSTR